MLLVIDNYDSFTYNLVQYLGELGQDIQVQRNDKISIRDIEELAPERIVISPGPCTPKEAGISKEVVSHFGPTIPILGVCLGHQSIGEVFGGQVISAPSLMHGKTSEVHHDQKSIFANIPSPFIATRYHSLIVEQNSLPKCFEISAWTADGIIMGIRHKEFPIHGIQFHPESILTTEGMNILGNWLST